MSKKANFLLPSTEDILKQVGIQIKLARLRRDLSLRLVAERAGLSVLTVRSIEEGSPSVSIGNYASVLHALGGLEKDLVNIAKDDVLGRTMQDRNMTVRKRASKGGDK